MKRDWQEFGNGIFVDPSVQFGESVRIGHASCIGLKAEPTNIPTIIGKGVRIGAFCVIEAGAQIGDDVEVDHYCRIGSGVTIGEQSKILYGVAIFNNVQVGRHCIVGGNLSERTILEDDITFSGAIAHSHRDPTLDWDTTDELSPIIRRGSVIGVEALLIGGVTVGPYSYVGAREIVRVDVPPKTVLLKGEYQPLSYWRGFIKVRGLDNAQRQSDSER